ncbi:MAG TPA: TlpA disulfide reductase family protein [Actinomycetota bacterium]|nr:TlpA disulfide reductase family protein [Actinomycetota bacterium]
MADPAETSEADQAAGPPPEPMVVSEGRVPTPKARRRLRLLAFVVIPALFVALLAVGLIRTQQPKARQGAPAPDFQLPLLGGGTLSSRELKGSPVVVNFWASWCVPCRKEAPVLEATFKQYEGRGVRFVGVDYEDLESDAQRFVREFGITYPSVRDTGGTLASAFGVRGVPETFFVDRQWRFFSIGQAQEVGARAGTKIPGPVTRRQLVSQIQELLASTPSAGAPGASDAPR